MPLQIITGKPHSGKTTYCFEIAKQLGNSGQNSIFIVPEQYSLKNEFMLYKFTQGSEKSTVLSFSRLAHYVFTKKGGIARNYINEAGKNIIISKILKKHEKELMYLPRKGIVKVVADLISEFKRYFVTPQHLKKALEEENENSLLYKKLYDLSIIYSDFEDEINDNYFDTDDNLKFLADILPGFDELSDTTFFIDGFSTFSSGEIEIVKILIEKALKVYVTFCSEDVLDNSGYNKTIYNTYKSLVRISEDLNTVMYPDIYLGNDKTEQKSPELLHLAENIYKYPPEVFTGTTGTVFIRETQNIYSEVSYAARQILCLCKNEKKRFRDFVIAVNDVSDYLPVVNSVFEEYGIKYFCDESAKIINHPVVAMITSALDAIKNNFKHDNVFKFLKSGIYGCDEDIDFFENYCLKKGIKWADYEKETKWDDQCAAKIKNRFIAPLTDFKNSIKNDKTATNYCTEVYSMLLKLNIQTSIEHLAEKFINEGKESKAEEYARVWNIIADALDKIVETSGDIKMNFNEFSDIFLSAVSSYEIGITPQTADEVLVTSYERYDKSTVDTLFIFSANAGSLPSYGVREGVLGDSDRENLYKKGIELAPVCEYSVYDSEYNLKRLLYSPSKSVYISYNLLGADGKEKRISPVINRIKKILPHIKIETDSDENSYNFYLSKNAGFNKMLCDIKLVNGEIEPTVRAANKWFSENEEFKQKYNDAIASLKYTNMPHKLPKDLVKKTFGENINLSVSRMERYSACHFSYFMQYMIKAEPRKIFEISVTDLGTIIHQVLDEFSKRVISDGLTFEQVTDEYIKAVTEELVDLASENMADGILKSSNRFLYFTKRIKRILYTSTKLLCHHFRNSEFVPLGFEISFDSDGDYEPISFDSVGNIVNIRGKIDRADIMQGEDESFVRIVDYKTGVKKFEFSEVYYGLSFQLLTYINALCKNLEKQGNIKVTPAGVLYFRIDSPVVSMKHSVSDDEAYEAVKNDLKLNGILLSEAEVIKKMDGKIEGDSDFLPVHSAHGKIKESGSTVTREEFARALQFVEEKGKEITQEMLCGDISINPFKRGTKTPCSYCDFASACAFDACINSERYLRTITKKEFFGNGMKGDFNDELDNRSEKSD